MQNWCALLCFLLFKPLHFFCNSRSLASPIRIQPGTGEERRLTIPLPRKIFNIISFPRYPVSFFFFSPLKATTQFGVNRHYIQQATHIQNLVLSRMRSKKYFQKYFVKLAEMPCISTLFYQLAMNTFCSVLNQFAKVLSKPT